MVEQGLECQAGKVGLYSVEEGIKIRHAGHTAQHPEQKAKVLQKYQVGAWIDKPIFEEESGLKTEIHSLIDVGTTVKKSRCNHQCKHTGGVWAGPQKSQH